VIHFKVARTANTRTAVAFAAPGTPPKNYPAEYQYDKAPEVKLSAAAVYPFEFATKNEAGSATLVFLIDPQGRPRRIEVREATQPEFGAAASAMIAAWQFTPAKKGGKPTWTMLAKKHTFDPKEGDSVLNESATRLVGELQKNPSSLLEGPGALDAGLKPRYQVAPALPEAMVAAGASAEAEIEIIVDRAGRVQLPRVVSATREDFGWAAATGVSRWLFVPPTQNGKPVDVRVRVPLSYDAPAKPVANPPPR
jgi:TonB family protein